MALLEKRYKVGVRLIDWAQGFGNRIFGGILDFLREGHEFELEFEQPSGGDLPKVKIDADWEGDGLLVFRYTAAEARAWAEKGIQVVNLSVEQPTGGPHFPRVTMDNVFCGRQAAERFKRLGLRQFVYWHDPNRTYSAERLQGFREALREDGFDCEVLSVPAATYPKRTRARQVAQAGWRQLAPLEPPYGIFAKDDIAAVCAVRVLAQLGVKVPGDAVVLGVADDIVYCHATNPPLSSLRFPGKKIGYEAASLLYRQMSGYGVASHSRVLVPSPGVVERESTGMVTLADELVRRAVEIMREEVVQGGLTAGELARRLGVSREQLRLRFHAVFGHGPKQEMDAIRAARIQDYLIGTGLTLQAIAERTGFGAQDELCRFFKRVTGDQPGVHRKSR
ncbi:substrate-binding domain-containing protein [Roseibacillus ishigakijimensis]|uniref:Substrate-binding domain-containing protein n=1 Tax=Roseibacillus ishigakijimensis TaxID=454146 RepID=A0A934VMU2_9BACT|nr:substrate-binding domain-containing protein [Roseibacillus ishigakijimensis]MBK1834632.1 substrate-binding domain-containing protein [Roseibacillus ishigakijimensis]